jgi:hypothetical protein
LMPDMGEINKVENSKIECTLFIPSTTPDVVAIEKFLNSRCTTGKVLFRVKPNV